MHTIHTNKQTYTQIHILTHTHNTYVRMYLGYNTHNNICTYTKTHNISYTHSQFRQRCGGTSGLDHLQILGQNYGTKKGAL